MTSVYRASLSTISSFAVLIAISATVRAADDGQWTMPGKNYSSTRYSELAEITSDNAKGLHPVWDLFDRCAGWPSGAAPRRQQHDVRRYALPQLTTGQP